MYFMFILKCIPTYIYILPKKVRSNGSKITNTRLRLGYNPGRLSYDSMARADILPFYHITYCTMR